MTHVKKITYLTSDWVWGLGTKPESQKLKVKGQKLQVKREKLKVKS